MKQNYSTKEVAELAGVHVSYVRRLVEQGKIPAEKVSRFWVIKAVDALAWIEARKAKKQAAL